MAGDNKSLAALDLLAAMFMPTNTPLTKIVTSPHVQPCKALFYHQIIEICALCFIVAEHTFVFMATLQKHVSHKSLLDRK